MQHSQQTQLSSTVPDKTTKDLQSVLDKPDRKGVAEESNEGIFGMFPQREPERHLKLEHLTSSHIEK